MNKLLTLTTSTLKLIPKIPNLRIQYAFTRRKDSQWIYSTKHEQQQFRKPGSISLYTHITSDTHNASLRFTQHVDKANIILTNSPEKVHAYLQAILKKQRFAYQENQTHKDTKQVQTKLQNTSLVTLRSNLQQKSLQYETDLQISKFIELQKQTNKQKGQTNNAYIAKESKQLKYYMSIKLMQAQLAEIKNKQGYPAIFQLKQSLKDVQQLQKDGFNILFAFCEGANNITQCGQVIRLLESNQLGFEILPCTDQMITAIVSSGLPADRFCIENLPTEDLEALLARRVHLKTTVCIQIQTQRLDDLVKAVVKIFGKQHIVYLHGENNQFYRGQVMGLDIYLNEHKPKTKTVYLVLSPMIVQFNEGLKAQLNIKSHIQGQIQSQKLNILQMEILAKKLEAIDKKQQTFQIDTHLMAAELLSTLKDEGVVKQCLKKMFPRMKQNKIQKMIQEGKSKVVVDHIGLKQSYKEGKP